MLFVISTVSTMDKLRQIQVKNKMNIILSEAQ